MPFYSTQYTSINYKSLRINEEQLVVYYLFSVFDSTETRILNKKIVDYEKVLTNQIAILTVDSKKTYDNIQKYGTDVASMWSLGDKEKKQWIISNIV